MHMQAIAIEGAKTDRTSATAATKSADRFSIGKGIPLLGRETARRDQLHLPPRVPDTRLDAIISADGLPKLLHDFMRDRECGYARGGLEATGRLRRLKGRHRDDVTARVRKTRLVRQRPGLRGDIHPMPRRAVAYVGGEVKQERVAPRLLGDRTHRLRDRQEALLVELREAGRSESDERPLTRCGLVPPERRAFSRTAGPDE